MKTPGFLDNTGVKATAGVAALEGLNVLGGNFHSLYNPEVGDVIGGVSGAVDGFLTATGVNGVIASNPIIDSVATGASGLGAMMLSNNILKDFGLDSGEGNTFGFKNILRYSANTATALTAYTAGSAAIPYIIGGSFTYWAGKHGWKYGKEAVTRLAGMGWGATAGTAKGAVVGGANSVKAGLKGEQKLNPVIS